MAVFHSPNIILDNLTLSLDAANAKSYPGSGSIWYDQSISKLQANMVGSVPFATDVTSCFDFATATGTASSNSTLGFTVNGSATPAVGDYSFEVWVKSVNAAVSQVGLISNAGGGDGFRFGVGTNGIYALCGPNYTEGSIGFSSSFDNNIWHQVVAVYNRTGSIAGSPRVLLYLDGVYQSFLSLPSVQTSQNNSAPGIVRSPCCGIFTGKLAIVRIYSSALAAFQILQNYQALSRRFGR